MALSVFSITSVTPRGGGPATQVTLVGSGFGTLTGTVVFDPLGENLPANIVSWTPTQIVFDVPALSSTNLFVEVAVNNQAASDGATFKFWVPDPAPGLGPFPPGLDYQLPNFEEDTLGENTDDPQVMSAADFNRLMDRVLDLGSVPPGAGDMLKSVYDIDDNGLVDCAEGIDDMGTCRTYADIISVINAGDITPVLDSFTPTSGQTVFILTNAPANPTSVLVKINGVDYTVAGGFFTVVSTTLTWLNIPFVLDPSDLFEVYYFM